MIILGADETRRRLAMRSDVMFWKTTFMQPESSENSVFDFSVYH